MEVLIALAILVFISFAIFQATTETYHLRDVLGSDGDFYSGIHLATSLMNRDISCMYSPIAAYPAALPFIVPGGFRPEGLTQQEIANQEAVLNSAGLNQTSDYWGMALDTTGLRPSRFIGTESKMSFIAVNHFRIYKDSPESEFAKISYDIQKDTKNQDHPETLVLLKRENPHAFTLDDIRDPAQKTYEILSGIKKIKYTYYQKQGDTWKTTSSWDSNREEVKNIFPDYIELSLEMVGPKNQFFEGKFKFRPEIPLNGVYSSF